MNQDQDELQAAINNITNGDGAAANNDVVSQIENKVSGVAPTMPDKVAMPSGEVDVEPVEQFTNGAFNISGASANSASNKATAPAVFSAPSINGQSNGAMAMNEPKQDKMGASNRIELNPQRAMYGDPDLDRVKTNALNEIRPILETVDIPFEKKFMIYKDIIELTDDKACIEPAYNAARQIPDDKTRAEALLYIIEIIDDLGIKMAH